MTSDINSPTPIRIYTAKHIFLVIALSLIFGSVAYYFAQDIFATINRQLSDLRDATRINQEQDNAIAEVQLETRKAIGDLPQQQESIRDQLAKLENAIGPIRTQLQQIEAESVTQQIDNDHQLARAMELRNLGHEITGIIKRAEHELTSFEDQKRNTETGDIGKSIAADADLLDLYAAVAEPNIGLARLVNWRNEVDTRLKTVHTIDENSNVELRIEPDAIRELTAIRNQTHEAYEQLRDKQATIREVVARAAGRTVTDDDVSLAVVLKQREQRRAFEIESAAHQRAQELLDRQAEKLAQAREETTQRRTNAALAFEDKLKDLIEEMSQQDEQALADAAAKIRQESEQRHARVLADLEQQRKASSYQAALPEIHEYLVPFISNGNTQPRKRHAQYETAASTGPVSLSKLKSHGALEDNPRGLFVLHALGAGSSNDRPSGRFPPYYGGSSVQPRQVPFFRKVQQLLRDYGDLMVKNGLLAK